MATRAKLVCFLESWPGCRIHGLIESVDEESIEPPKLWLELLLGLSREVNLRSLEQISPCKWEKEAINNATYRKELSRRSLWHWMSMIHRPAMDGEAEVACTMITRCDVYVPANLIIDASPKVIAERTIEHSDLSLDPIFWRLRWRRYLRRQAKRSETSLRAPRGRAFVRKCQHERSLKSEQQAVSSKELCMPWIRVKRAIESRWKLAS